MMKEIHEQPKAVQDTLSSVVKDGQIDLSEIGLTDENIQDIDQIYIIACGSAYHVGMAAQYVFEDMVRVPVRVELASEFRYRNPILNPKALAIIISQSGETADSLAALRLCKENNIRTLGIVNVVGSSIAREADNVFYTLAGPEISVATTKAYSTQLIAAYVLAIQFAKVKGTISEEQYAAYIKELETLPDKIQRIIDDKERIQWFASKQANAKDVFFIGRGLTTFGNYNIEDTADFTVYMPKTDPHFATSLAVIPLQLLGYYVSVAKGLDVDKPRNLAKSVTVE